MVELDCGGKLGKFLLVTTNGIFILLGLGLIIPGILVQLNVSIINNKVLSLLNQLSFAGIPLGQATSSLSIALIAIGSAILILSALGACGACHQSRTLLVVYSLIVLVLLVGQCAIGALWIVMKTEVETKVKAELVSQLHNNYVTDDLTSHTISTAWNYMSMQLSCCGVSGVTGQTNDYDSTVWQGTSPSQDIPKSCCGATVTDYTTFSFSTCTANVTSGYYTVGCYSAMKTLISTYSSIFIGIVVVVIVVETLAVICAFCICSGINKVRSASPGT